MILGVLLDALKVVLQTALGFINLPNLPQNIDNSIRGFIDMIFDNLGIVGFFIRWETIQIAVPLVIAVANLDHIYDGIMWIIRKIPMLGME